MHTALSCLPSQEIALGWNEASSLGFALFPGEHFPLLQLRTSLAQFQSSLFGWLRPWLSLYSSPSARCISLCSVLHPCLPFSKWKSEGLPNEPPVGWSPPHRLLLREPNLQPVGSFPSALSIWDLHALSHYFSLKLICFEINKRQEASACRKEHKYIPPLQDVTGQRLQDLKFPVPPLWWLLPLASLEDLSIMIQSLLLKPELL